MKIPSNLWHHLITFSEIMQPTTPSCGLCIQDEQAPPFLPDSWKFLLILRFFPCMMEKTDILFQANSFQRFSREANYGKQFPRHRATTFLAPIPAVSSPAGDPEPGFDGHNLITVAWAGVVNSDPPMVSVSIRPSRHSYAQILQSGAFCLNLIDQPHLPRGGFLRRQKRAGYR